MKQKTKKRKPRILKQLPIKQRLEQSLTKNKIDKEYFDRVLTEYREDINYMQRALSNQRTTIYKNESEIHQLRTENENLIEAISMIGMHSRLQRFESRLNPQIHEAVNQNATENQKQQTNQHKYTGENK